MRTALGADKRRLARELLGESLVLGLFWGLVGLGLAYGGIHLLVAMGPASVPRLYEVGIDATVLVFTVGLSLLAGVFFGLIPVLKYAPRQQESTARKSTSAISATRVSHASVPV